MFIKLYEIYFICLITMEKIIYLDNAATTKVDGRVVKSMMPYFSDKYGNASSTYFFGLDSKTVLENSRNIIAKSVGANSEEIYFTSGGTEGNNLALEGLFFYNKDNKTGKNHIITSKIEHDSIINTCKWLEKQGAKITYLDVDEYGFVNLKQLEKEISGKTIVVSIIHGNNEIGTIQNLEEIGKICRKKKTLFHTDACQSYTKTFIDVRKQNIDLMTLNSHKIHGPKGVGALYIRKGVKITPIMHGGEHEMGIRSGTENVSGIVGFSKAVELSEKKDISKMIKLRDKLIEGILKLPNTNLNGPIDSRLCNNVNVTFNNLDGESIGRFLEVEGICTSTGSACSSHTKQSSHVLKAIGRMQEQIESSLRISISKYTSDEEIDFTLKNLEIIIKKLRKNIAV